MGLSHTHFDHMGNIALFPNATWLIEKSEYAYIQKTPLASSLDASEVAILQQRHKMLFPHYLN